VEDFVGMSRHGDVNEQLVVELYVRDFSASCTFYQAFGFLCWLVLATWHICSQNCQLYFLYLSISFERLLELD